MMRLMIFEFSDSALKQLYTPQVLELNMQQVIEARTSPDKDAAHMWWVAKAQNNLLVHFELCLETEPG